MRTAMKLVEDFIQAERSNSNWLEKLFMNYPEFLFPKDIEIKQDPYNLKPNVTIRPSIFRRLIASAFTILGLIAWLIFLNMVIQNILFPITLIFLMLISVWTGFVIWTFFLNPKYSYKIFISKNAIRTNKLCLPWEAISEVLIMVKGGGRRQVSTLVIFGNDNKIYRFALQNLGMSNHKILKTIKLYRQQAKT